MTLDERALVVRTLIGNRYLVFFAVSKKLNLKVLLIGRRLMPDAIYLVDSITRLLLFSFAVIGGINLNAAYDDTDDEEKKGDVIEEKRINYDEINEEEEESSSLEEMNEEEKVIDDDEDGEDQEENNNLSGPLSSNDDLINDNNHYEEEMNEDDDNLVGLDTMYILLRYNLN